MNERLYKGKYMNKSIIIKEKQGKKSRRTTFCLQQQETKNSGSKLYFRLGFDVQSTGPKLTDSFPKSAEFKVKEGKFSDDPILFVVRIQRKMSKKKSISHNLHKKKSRM